MIAVADSSALIALAVCDALKILEKLFKELKVPQTVFNEVIIKGKPEATSLQIFLSEKIVHVDLTSLVITSSGIGRGELEAMALYKILKADYLIIDDKRARRVARLNNINLAGSQGILLLAKHKKGIISNVKPFLDRLRVSNIHISDRMIKRTLQLADEN